MSPARERRRGRQGSASRRDASPGNRDSCGRRRRRPRWCADWRGARAPYAPGTPTAPRTGSGRWPSLGRALDDPGKEIQQIVAHVGGEGVEARWLPKARMPARGAGDQRQKAGSGRYCRSIDASVTARRGHARWAARRGAPPGRRPGSGSHCPSARARQPSGTSALQGDDSGEAKAAAGQGVEALGQVGVAAGPDQLERGLVNLRLGLEIGPRHRLQSAADLGSPWRCAWAARDSATGPKSTTLAASGRTPRSAIRSASPRRNSGWVLRKTRIASSRAASCD